MEADAEIYSQTLGRAKLEVSVRFLLSELKESCGRGRRRIVDTRDIKDTTGNLTESTNLGCYGLRLN